MWLLYVVSPNGVVWPFSHHGSWVLSASSTRAEGRNAVLFKSAIWGSYTMLVLVWCIGCGRYIMFYIDSREEDRDSANHWEDTSV